MTMDSLDDKRRFVERHKEEISPLVDSISDVDAAIEAYRVKVFKLEKPKGTYARDAKRMALSASDPLQLGTSRTIIERAVGDPRFRSILLMTDNVAAQAFGRLIKNDPRYQKFGEVDTTNGIINSLGRETRAEPVDIALTFLESPNSPSGSLAYEWKSAYKARKFYLINDGWNGIGQRRDFFSRLNPKDVDGILCNDEVARNILVSQMPAFEKKIRVTGTPVLDSLGLEKGKASRESGRAKLGLSHDEIAMLFRGDVVADLTSAKMNVDERINVRTLEKLIEAAVIAAQAHPEKRYAILVQPHGRDDADDVRALLATKLPKGSPNNLRLLDASESKLNVLESAFATDLMTSINSTANHLAPPRGGDAIFLAFEDRLGVEVLKTTYGDSYADIVSGPGLHLVRTVDELAQVLGGSKLAGPPDAPRQGETATDRMFDEILGVRGDAR